VPTGSRTGGKKRAKQKVKCTCSSAAAAFPCFLLTDRVYLVSLISPLATHLSPLPSTTLPSALPVRSAEEVGLEGKNCEGWGGAERERKEAINLLQRPEKFASAEETGEEMGQKCIEIPRHL